MAASMLYPKRPPLPRALSSKNSNPYLAMNKATATGTTSTTSSTHPPIPDLIMPGLYLTDPPSPPTNLPPKPSRPHIKYTLSILDNSMTQPHPKPANRESLFTQRLIILDDTPDADLLFHLASACDWIEECINKSDGGVLVHCHLGQSRSAAVVIAYMMRKQNIPLQKALEKVKWRRSMVKPNPGFMRQLGLWEEMAFDVWEDVLEDDEQEKSDHARVAGASGPETTMDPKTSAETQQQQQQQEDPKDNEEKAAAIEQPVTNGIDEVKSATAPLNLEKTKSTIRRRKQAYESWKMEQEKRTKRYLDNLA